MSKLLEVIRNREASASDINLQVKEQRFGDAWKTERSLREMDFCCDRTRHYVDTIDYLGKICEVALEMGRLRNGLFIATIKYRNKIVLQTEPFPNVSVAVSMAYLMLCHKQQTCECGDNKFKDCAVPRELCFIRIP